MAFVSSACQPGRIIRRAALSRRRRALLSLNQDIDRVRRAPEAIDPDEDPILRTLDNPTSPMPSFRGLPAEKKNNLVAFLAQLDGSEGN